MPDVSHIDERERFQQLSQLFDAARDLSEREAALFVANVEDPWLREELAEMLRLDREGTPTVHTLVDLSGVLEESDSQIDIPAKIGGYKVLGVIGFGASGVVLRARQPATDRIVAIKVLGSGAWNPGAIQRFKREIRLLGRLEHPGIARIYDSGSDTAVVPARPFFVMEFVDGTPLNRWAADDGTGSRRSPQEIARAFEEIAQAIHHAHEAGVVHRDLKPGNLLVTKQGQPKVLDFGVSGVLGETGFSSTGGSSSASRRAFVRDTPTQTVVSLGDAVVGTVPYMSPEQFDGTRAVDRRSDLYAIGVMLFECLAGRLPYTLDLRAITEAAAVIRDEVPSTLGRVDRSLRGDLETVVARLLEKDPDRRYQTAEELAFDLHLFGAGEPTRTRPVARIERVRRFAVRYRTLIVATVVTFAMLLGILGYTLNLWRESEQRGASLSRALETSESLEYRRAIRDAEAALRAGVVLDARRALAAIAPHRRGWEWRYLAGRAGAELQVIPMPEMPISVAVIDRSLLVGSLNGSVYRLDPDSGEPTRVAQGKASASEVAVSPDGQSFVVVDAREPSLPVRSTVDGSLLCTLPLPFGGSTALDWSQDGTHIAVAGNSGSAAMLCAVTGDVEHFVPGLDAGTRRGEGLVKFLPDGSGFAHACRSSSVAQIVRFDGTPTITLDVAQGVVERIGVATRKSGAVVLVGFYNGEIAVFDAADGMLVRRIRAHTGALRAIAQGPGAFECTSGATDGSIRVWNVESGELVGSAIGAELQVRGLAFDPMQQELISVGEDGFVRRWSIANDVREPVLRQHQAWVYSLACIPDGSAEGILVSGAGEAPASDGRVVFWNVGARAIDVAVNPLEVGAANIVWSVAHDPMGAIACATGRVIRFVSRTGAVTGFAVPTAPYRVAVADKGRLIAVRRFECAALEFYDRTGTLVQSIEMPFNTMGDLKVRGDGNELLVAVGGTLLVYRFRDGQAFEADRHDFEGTLTSVSGIDSGHLVAVGLLGGDVALVDLSPHSPVREIWRVLASPDDNVRVALSPDGTRVASVGKGPLVRILDATDGEQVLTLGGHGDTILSLAYSLDGGTLATGSIDGTVRVWRAAELDEFPTHPSRTGSR
jgi:serine/threonine protein kinase/WD40 repeat protein